jgi:diacylglycerol kinase
MSDPRLPQHQAPNSEWAKFIAGFGYAFRGLWYALRTQRNARVHISIAILAILLGIVLRISAVEFAMVFVAITGVFLAEMFNTVFEICVDLASPEYHPLAKIAKDVAAGAVLLSAMLSVVIGLFVFVPHLWGLLHP